MELVLPELIISKDLIERIQFSVSSRNAEAKLSKCAVHIFAAPYSDDPHDIKWQYVSSGVACLLRNRELVKSGRRYMWSISFCLYNASYGVIVWKAKLLPNSDYTDVTDNFHVFALSEVNVLIGLMFSESEQACELNATYTLWNQERERDDGKRGYIHTMGQDGHEPMKFDKKMISKPCNFQHIQGTQAIEECLDIEKIKSDIVAFLFGMGTKEGRSETLTSSNGSKSKRKKKEPTKAKLEFKEIELPQAQSSGSPPATPTAISLVQGFDLSSTEITYQEGMVPAEIPPTNQERNHESSNSQVHNPMAASRPGQDYSADSDSYPGGLVAGGYNPNQNQGRVAELDEVLSSRGGDQPPSSPNFETPSSPSYQKFTSVPPRMDMSLEKELANSPIFNPSLMTAN